MASLTHIREVQELPESNRQKKQLTKKGKEEGKESTSIVLNCKWSERVEGRREIIKLKKP